MLEFLKEFKWILFLGFFGTLMVSYHFYNWEDDWNTPEVISCFFDYLLLILILYIAYKPEDIFDKFF